METTVKHFTFKNADGQHGRFAVAFDCDRVRYASLAGVSPQAQHLLGAIAQFPELIVAANEAAKTRVNPYTVSRRHGMSGCIDYLLVECRDPAFNDFPTRARLHVSMYGKLNYSFNMWLGDFPVLVWEMSKDFPDDAEAYPVEEARFRPYPPEGWLYDPVELIITPSNSSVTGLQVAPAEKEEEEENYVAWDVLKRLDDGSDA